MVDTSLVQLEARKLFYEAKERYGDIFVTRRKEPFLHSEIRKLLDAPDGLELGARSRRLQWRSRFGRSLRAAICVSAQTGFRKAEWTRAAAGVAFTGLSRRHRWFLLRGTIYYNDAPAHLLRDPRPGDCVILQPPCSKPDPFDVEWGDKPIYLPYQPGEPLSAFAAIADLELHHLHGQPPSTPLFADDEGEPLLAAMMDSVLHALMVAVLGSARALVLSWHSFRIFLACALLAANVPAPHIQALCRWQSIDSLRIYARLGAQEYTSLLGQAMRSRISTAQTTTLRHGLPLLSAAELHTAAHATASEVIAAIPSADDDALLNTPDDEDDAAPPPEPPSPALPATPPARARPPSATPATTRAAPVAPESPLISQRLSRCNRGRLQPQPRLVVTGAAAALPEGWRHEQRVTPVGRRYAVFVGPSGRRAYSRPQVFRIASQVAPDRP